MVNVTQLSSVAVMSNVSDSQTSSPRQTNGHFATGNPGGPGRPRNAVARGAVVLDVLGTEVAESIVRVIVDKALAGDLRAAELVLSRAWPMRHGRPTEVAAFPIESPEDCVAAVGDVTQAAMRGDITAHEGRALAAVIDVQRRTIETVEQEQKAEELDARLARYKEYLK